jgi:hypothetical protein
MRNLLSCLAAWPDRLRTDRRGTVSMIVGLTSIALVSGVVTGYDQAMKVVTTSSIPFMIGSLFISPSTQTAVTVSATSVAEIEISGGSGGQPCAVALKSGGTGIGVSGAGSLATSSCTVVWKSSPAA